MTTPLLHGTTSQTIQMTKRLHTDDIFTGSLHSCCRRGWRKAPPRAGCPAVQERRRGFDPRDLAATPAGPGIAVIAPGRSW